MADAPGKTPLLKNKKVMIAVAIVVVAGLAYYLYKRNANNAATVSPTADSSSASPDNGLGSAGLGPAPAGSDTSALDALAATLQAQQANDAQLSTANQNLYGSIITGQEGLIADLAGSVQTVSKSAIDQLGYVAASEAGTISSIAAGEPSKAATPTTADPIQPHHDVPADGGGGSGVYIPPVVTGTTAAPEPASVQAKLGVDNPAVTANKSGASANKKQGVYSIH